MKHLILYDGVCGLCNGLVQWVLRRDRDAIFSFASLQSDCSRKLLDKYRLPTETMDTIVLIENYGQSAERALTESTGVFLILKTLPGPWKMLSVFLILPKTFRDRLYRFIAARRYRYFGAVDHCMAPSKDVAVRFLDDCDTNRPVFYSKITLEAEEGSCLRS